MCALKPLKGISLSTVSSCLEAELKEYKERECDGGVVRVVEELMEVYRCEGRVLDRTRMLTEQAILNRKKGDRSVGVVCGCGGVGWYKFMCVCLFVL